VAVAPSYFWFAGSHADRTGRFWEL